MKYEDVSWHTAAEDYPKDLSPHAAGTHTGMFLAWALLGGLGSTLHAGSLAKLRERKLTPGAYFQETCDGKFSDKDLSAEGNAFARAYFDAESGRYARDYDAMLCDGLATAYHVRDTWQNFDKLKPRLDRRFTEWRAGRLGERPWWRFWEPFVLLIALAVMPLFFVARFAVAADCAVPGDKVHWIADYCMARLQTDDEIPAMGCIEEELKKAGRDDCAVKARYKRELCTLVQNENVDRCVADPAFMGRTVRNGGIGG